MVSLTSPLIRSLLSFVMLLLLGKASADSGVSLMFTTAKDIPAFEDRLIKGGYDIAYMNPYHFTVYHETPGYLPLVTHKNQKLKGIFVVKKDSDITNLNALSGAELAFPAPAAFAATILPQAHLRQLNIPFTPRYVSSHDSVYLGVAKGLFKAGGGVKRTFNAMPEEIRTQLKIVWTTPPYTAHAIAIPPRIPEEVRQRVTEALLQLADTEEGLALLKTIQVPNGFRPAQSSDWDDVRALQLNLLSQP